MSYNDGYNNRSEYGGGRGARDDYYSDNRRDDGYDNRGGDYNSGRRNDNYDNRREDYGGRRNDDYGSDRRDDDYGSRRNEGRYNDTRYDDNAQNRYSSQNNDYSGALSHAQQHGGDQDSSFFSQALSFLNQNKDRISSNSNINEEQAVKAHQSLYGGGGGNMQHTSQTLGAGAAIQALKMFTSHGSSGGSGVNAGGDMNQLIGMAMAQASKLWDQQGGNASGDKQSTINSAAEMAMKMYMKSQGGSGNSGLGGTGGPSGLLSLASKFL